MLLVRCLITALCAAGFYASVFMQRKHLRAEQGKVHGPSVVKSPRAKLFGRIPNSEFGMAYYVAVVIVAWAVRNPILLACAEAAALLAAGTSAYLAYSLLFITKKSCPYCWTSHAVNFALLVIIPWLWLLR